MAVLGLQHAIESASKVTLPVAMMMSVGATAKQVETLIETTLIMCGIATILVSSRLRLVGFGRLMPVAILSSFVSPALLAARAGGLPLVAGMTLVTGIVVAGLSRVLHRWRFLFPPEVVGLIAFMVGASQASLAVSRFLGIHRMDQTPASDHLFVASATIGLLAGLTVWGKGKLRLFSTLITLMAGYFLAGALGMVSAEQWQRVTDAPWIGLPTVHPPGMAFDPSLVLPFAVLGLSAALKASGDLTIAEKISDADWKRADLKAGSAAVLTFGLSTMLSACLGGFAMMSSSSNVGLSAATGAASRRIGYACGAILISLACVPKLVALIGITPAPVVGATLLLVVSYNLIAGMQIIMSRMMEARHTYIIGMSLLFGLSADAMPGAYANLPNWLRPLFASGLTLATTMVVLLNMVFRLGTSRRHSMQIAAGEDAERIYTFLEEFGAEWGARREVIERAVSAVVEFYEMVFLMELAMGSISIETVYDEFKLTVLIRYRGTLPEAQKPGLSTVDLDLWSADQPSFKMSAMLLHRLADRVRMKAEGLNCEVEISFDQ